MLLCDLHTHSTFSDGTFSPEQILQLAKEAKLGAVALTDHNTIDGLKIFVEKSKDYGVEAVRGVEISADYGEKELHIVALFLKEEAFPQIESFLNVYLKRKEESNLMLAKRLKEAGYNVDYEKIKKENIGAINRVHFAKQLLNSGQVASIKEAMEGILSKKKGFYVPPKRFTSFEVIEFIKSINAVAVLAHPLLNLTKDELVEFLIEAKKHGLDAIETRYSAFSLEEQEYLEKLATKFNLLLSGGSDFHGTNKPNIAIGKGFGDLQVPLTFAENLKKKI